MAWWLWMGGGIALIILSVGAFYFWSLAILLARVAMEVLDFFQFTPQPLIEEDLRPMAREYVVFGGCFVTFFAGVSMLIVSVTKLLT